MTSAKQPVNITPSVVDNQRHFNIIVYNLPSGICSRLAKHEFNFLHLSVRNNDAETGDNNWPWIPRNLTAQEANNACSFRSNAVAWRFQ
jgi:hypothetical protein